MAVVDEEQQFCLRWNNFQANITSQFEALRDDEDFTDVTIACEGQRIQAHKVVLSACSPFFKELFKSNPCSHPIIFMRDVEACDIVSLMEFMYAGEVNVAQSHLSAFLKTAESLKIRGLTDTSANSCGQEGAQLSAVTSSQEGENAHRPSKKLCKPDSAEQPQLKAHEGLENGEPRDLQPKMEAPECLDDIEIEDLARENENEIARLPGGMEIIPQSSGYLKEMKHEVSNYQGRDSRKLHSLDPRPCEECGKVYSNLSNLRQHMRLIHYPTFVQCNYCQKPFKTDLYLRRHVMSAHGVPHADGSTKTYMKYYEFSKSGMACALKGNYYQNQK